MRTYHGELGVMSVLHTLREYYEADPTIWFMKTEDLVLLGSQ